MMKWINDRAFAHYREWECWRDCVLYGEPTDAGIQNAVAVLSDADRFAAACVAVFHRWPVSTAVSLSDTGRNRRAWLGRAAACIDGGSAELATRAAWWMLTVEQQDRANEVADEEIAKWELETLPSGSYRRQNVQLAFQF
jgi:hypothetical protein